MNRHMCAAVALVSLLTVPIGAGPAHASSPATYHFTVVFQSTTLPANAAAVVQSAGGTVISQIPQIGVLEVSGPSTIIQSLQANTSVASVGPELRMTVDPVSSRPFAVGVSSFDSGAADLFEYQWDIREVTNDGASFSLGTGSHNTVVGLIDTGVDTDHPDLAANLLGGRNFVADEPDGTVIPTDIEDRIGHGSYTAGAVAGNGHILGVGPDLGFREYRVVDAYGQFTRQLVNQAIVAAVDDGVDVISISLGSYLALSTYAWTDPSTGQVYRIPSDVADFVAMKRAIHYAVGKGAVVVASAGNDHLNLANPHDVVAFANEVYGPDGFSFNGAGRHVPGPLPGVVTVSATTQDMNLASYSNFGSGAIDVSAPGGADIDLAKEPGRWPELCLGAYLNGDYGVMKGTSAAAPKAAAVAALIIDQAKAHGQRLSPSQVVAKLDRTSTDLGKTGYDGYFGYGMVNAYTALGGN